MVEFIIDEKFGSFEIAAAHSDVIVLFRKIELSEAPVDDSHLNEGVNTLRLSWSIMTF